MTYEGSPRWEAKRAIAMRGLPRCRHGAQLGDCEQCDADGKPKEQAMTADDLRQLAARVAHDMPVAEVRDVLPDKLLQAAVALDEARPMEMVDLWDAWEGLDERGQDVVIRWLQGATFAEIGAAHEVSRQRAHQILSAAIGQWMDDAWAINRSIDETVLASR